MFFVFFVSSDLPELSRKYLVSMNSVPIEERHLYTSSATGKIDGARPLSSSGNGDLQRSLSPLDTRGLDNRVNTEII